MKVLIAVPSFDLCHSDFTTSLAGMLMHRAYDRAMSRDVKIAYQNVKSTIIQDARNMLVDSAQREGCTHIFFLDSDIVFPANTLNRLITHHKPIVGSTYVKRSNPHPLLGQPEPRQDTAANGGLVTMIDMPMGCMLINMKVFESLSRPYFNYITGPTPETTVSEDIGFCRAVRALNTYAIMCDPNLSRELGHLTTKAMRLPQ